MKRLLAVLAVSVSIFAHAADEAALFVRVADVSGIVSALGKIGEFIGNPLLAMPLTAGLSNNPVIKIFGPGREGVAIAAVITVDSEKEFAVETLSQSLHYAVLYPIAEGKAGFLRNHPDATEENGLVRLADPDAHVVFSADDKWAVMSDSPDAARAACAYVPRAAMSLEGDVVQCRVTATGMKLLAAFAEKFPEEDIGMGLMADIPMGASLGRSGKILRQIKSLAMGLRVDDRGMAMRTRVVPAADSPYAKLGPEPLADVKPLAFAGKDALLACAWAKDCAQGDLDAAWSNLTACVTKAGFDLSWLTCAKAGMARMLTLDVDRALAYLTTTGMARCATMDCAQVLKDAAPCCRALDPGAGIEGVAGAWGFGIKGFETLSDASERFARLAPEAAAKKPYRVSVISLYAFLHALSAKVVAVLPERERGPLALLLQTLPPMGVGGIASYDWRAGEALNSVIRVSPDEIKGLVSFVGLGTAYIMQQKMQAMQLDVSDDDDDED